MKKFFKDYVDLCKHSGQFMKKHWLGYIIATLVLWMIEIAYFAWRWDMWHPIEWIKEKFHKKEDSNMSDFEVEGA